MKLAWFSLDGRVGPTIAVPQPWREGLGVSPDGARLLASAEDGLWMFDVATGARQRITTSRSDVSPRFVGDGGGSGDRPSLSRWEVAWVDLDTPATIHRLGGAHGGARFPDVSPDGRLVAYVSGETGRDEIYLTQLPNGEGKWQLSDNGGGWVRISPRGDRVVYRALNGDMMSVALGRGDGNAVTIGRPEKLFTWGSGWAMFYDLAPDGQRGVAAMSEAQVQAVSGLSIVQNWHTEFLARGR
jgi:dipeptidyl aminopeptidase/acylaminoacyl peptidase